MAPFAVSCEVRKLGFGSKVLFCIQVHNGSETLNIITTVESYGKHFMGISEWF